MPPTSPQRGRRVVLISLYELGRQPFALAEPAAWLRGAGFDVVCVDLSLARLDTSVLSGAALVALHLSMHTATRIAAEAIPRIRDAAPDALLCAYGLYAPMNAKWLSTLGTDAVLGGEMEPGLVRLAEWAAGTREEACPVEPLVSRAKVDFVTPDRSDLPPLDRYAHLILPDGGRSVVGFTEASRGCKHLCRHCPIVPVYEGRFRIVPLEVVLDDIAQQHAAGARHISFGDPDFLNGPTHARRLIGLLRQRFPDLTFDATIKIEHLLAHEGMLAELKEAGCRFITSAVESLEDEVLRHLAKGHTRADFERALALCRAHGLALLPTFVPFTPWTTLESYADLLRALVDLKLVRAVAPVQLSIRLLVPAGSYLLRLEGFGARLDPFDERLLGYPWRHEDPRVDVLQQRVQAWVGEAEAKELPRERVFEGIWRMAHEAIGVQPPSLAGADHGDALPRLSEPWYCCAEPTTSQLTGF
ncbi:MAG: CUAEP/CCAEP-tail radical SAM protein [Betaproteobacteria bacterium]|nr:CUAEP/CCAEP-tail radical SAM protein [Betaproteobacteria bacterium]